MGYFTKDIAKESKRPNIISLASNPNYIEFESLNDSSGNKPIEISLQVVNTNVDVEKTKIVIREAGAITTHELKGTRNIEEVNNTTFFIHEDRSVTAENIRGCLMLDDFFRSNFYISIPAINNVSSLDNGDTIQIKSIGTGSSYIFTFDAIDKDFIRLSGSTTNTSNNDTISGGSVNCEIGLDLYRDTNIFLGVDDTPRNNISLGTYIAPLTKAYYNTPVWFNLNALIGSNKVFSNEFLNAESWCNAGTITDYRFIARKFDGVNREPFYISDALYVITGYERNLEPNDLSRYVYDTRVKNIVKPLTKQPQLTHIKGQTQYFNFILSDPDRNANSSYDLGIMYKLFSHSKKKKGQVIAHSQDIKKFNIVNTIKLDIDGAIEDNNIGYVEVCLCRSGEQISEPLKFTILPECLYKVKDFAFLNSLGGWSSFNFSGVESTDFKASTNIISKTQTPSHDISSEIESIYSKEIEEKFTVQTMPINQTVVSWLKELSSSIAVYELATKRYIIVDELQIKPNSKDELFRLEMKYHYSDSYNALTE